MELILPTDLLTDLVGYCRSEAPREAVGLLAAPDRQGSPVCGWAPLSNRANDPQTTFFVPPHEQFRVERSFAEREWVVAAAFHSHPQRDAQPSGADCEFLSETRPMLIVSLAEPQRHDPHYGDDLSPHELLPAVPSPLRAWTARDGETEEVRLLVQQVAA